MILHHPAFPASLAAPFLPPPRDPLFYLLPELLFYLLPELLFYLLPEVLFLCIP
jgi:hypothetical protein